MTDVYRELAQACAVCSPKSGSMRDITTVMLARPWADALQSDGYCATWITGGCQVPAPGGKIEGGSVFGQYNRMTM